jgi:hypothetical protein
MQFFQLKITLSDIKPPIWRRILVAPEIKLDKLHEVLQIIMGWTNSHLHQFETPDGYFANPSFGLEETQSSTKATLVSVLHGPKSHIRYEYDMGDSWDHQIVLEKVVEADQPFLALCLDGKRACPPEDCGGFPGYENLLEILKNPKHPEHEEMSEWVDSEFDSEAFDLEDVNAQLALLAAPRKKKAAAKKTASRSAKRS